MTQRRRFPTKTTDPTPADGEAVFDKVQEYAAWALNNTPAILTLDTGTGGSTANALVATSETAIASYQAGQRHILYPIEANDSAVTIEIDGLSSRAIVNPDGTALVGGEFATDYLVELLDDGTQLRIVSILTAGSGLGSIDVQEFTSSGTWSKPAGTYKWAEVLMIGGGGEGATSATADTEVRGGSGGSAAVVRIPFTSLGNSESVTIGAGGNDTATGTGEDGGDSTFGAWLTCPGGLGGTTGAGEDFTAPPDPPSFASGVYPINVESGGKSGTTNTSAQAFSTNVPGDTTIAGPGGASSTTNGTASNFASNLSANAGVSGWGANSITNRGGGGNRALNSGASTAARFGQDGYCQVVCY